MYQMAFKYAGSAILVISLFYLTITGKMDVNQYIGLVFSILAGLGAYHAGVGGSDNGGDSSPTPPPPTTPKAP